MRRTPLILACLVLLGAGVASGVSHPQHHKAQLVAADTPSPPPSAQATVPILFNPTTTTSTTSTTLPPTTTTAVHPATTRAPRLTTSSPQPHAQAVGSPVAGDLTFPPNCLSHGFWASFHQTNDKIPYAHQCWDALLAQYSWDTSKAFSVLMCESEGDPNDVNSSGATGLMQVITKGASTEPNQNMRQAWAKYTGAGNSWSPWSPSSSCSSRKQKG